MLCHEGFQYPLVKWGSKSSILEIGFSLVVSKEAATSFHTDHWLSICDKSFLRLADITWATA